MNVKEFHEYRVKLAETVDEDMALDDRRHGLNIKTSFSELDIKDIKSSEGKLSIAIENYETLMKKGLFFGSAYSIPNDIEQKLLEKIFSTLGNTPFEQLHKSKAHIHIINIPKNFHHETPIIINRNISGNIFTHTLIIAEHGSKFDILLRLEGDPEFCCDIIEFFNEGKCSFNTMNRLSSGKYLTRRNIYSGKGSITKIYSLDAGSEFMAHDASVNLEEGSEATINNIYHAPKDSSFDIYTKMNHIGKSTKSLMKSTGVLDNSRVISRGLIKISENAGSSNGYQKSDALLLGDARIISIPDLEIHNDDVKCTHGSTITKLDDDKLFYISSKGIGNDDARKMLIDGFYFKAMSEMNPEVMSHFTNALGMEKQHLRQQEDASEAQNE